MDSVAGNLITIFGLFIFVSGCAYGSDTIGWIGGIIMVIGVFVNYVRDPPDGGF